MRTTAILTTVLLSAGLVAGCGSDGGDKGSTGDYCKELKAAKADFDTFDSDTPDFNKFDDAINSFHELADGAPSEVADDWKTVDGALTAMEKALADAGLKMEDIGAISAGKLPEGMTAEDVQKLGPKLQTAFSGLDSKEVDKAGDAIEKHAKSECDIDLSK
jgi:hypothetical protein